MKIIKNNIILKFYIYHLLKILFLFNDFIELEKLLSLYNTLFIIELHKFKNFNSKFKFFLKEYRKIKNLIIKKHNIIFYNKIYKILYILNKLLINNDVNTFLNLSLDELKNKNLFLNLPFNIEIKLIIKKK